MSETAAPVPEVQWDEFYAALIWRQGEHVALVGPTGQGKTTLALSLLQRRSHIVIFATKPRDSTLKGLTKRGWKIIRKWPPPATSAKVILWPMFRDQSDMGKQRGILKDAITKIFHAESWCIFADDVQYLTDHLKLGPDLRILWLQARSLNISLVAATQRPRWVPREMWSQSTHLFLWQTADFEDLKALGGLNGVDSKLVRETVQTLAPHEVLYINTRTRYMVRTMAPAHLPKGSNT